MAGPPDGRGVPGWREIGFGGLVFVIKKGSALLGLPQRRMWEKNPLAPKKGGEVSKKGPGGEKGVKGG